MLLVQRPTLPGNVIRHQVVNRWQVKQTALAFAIGISRVRVDQILKGHAPITASVALLFGQVTSTDPAYWLQLQTRYDRYRASPDLRGTLDKLPPLSAGHQA